MNHRIIRIAAVLTGCILITTGCIWKGSLDPDEEAIRFSAGSLLLRDDATKSTEAYYDNTSFGVFAFMQSGGGVWADLASRHWTPNFMFNQEVSHSSGTSYTYSPTRYWPDANMYTLSFWAYSPYQASPVLYQSGTSTSYSSETAGLPDIQYTTNCQTDFLVSDVVADQTRTSNAGLVSFTFNHALSLVDMKVQKVNDPTDRYTVTLKSVRLDGICATAVLRDGTWVNGSNRQNFPFWADDPSVNTDDIVLTASEQTIPGSIMPIPQDLNNAAARLHVEFSVWYSGILQERTTTRDVLLSDVFADVSAQWANNSHYTLTIKISPDDPIEFTVSWSTWGADHNYHLSS